MKTKNIAVIAATFFLLLLAFPLIANITSFAIGDVKLSVPSKLLPSIIQLPKEEPTPSAGGAVALPKEEVMEMFNITEPIELFFALSPESLEVPAGGVLNIRMEITLPDFFKNKEVGVEYNILDKKKAPALVELETRVVGSRLSFIKQIQLPEEIVPDAYILQINLYYEGKKILSDWAVFTVRERIMYTMVSPVLARIAPFMLAAILADGIAILVILLYAGKPKAKKRRQ